MTKLLSEYSADELFALAEKKRLEENRPEVKCYINSSGVQVLVDLAQSYLSEELEGDEVNTQYAYETLMEFVYGNDVWDYISSVRD